MSKYILLSKKEARLKNLDKHGYYTMKDRDYLTNNDWLGYSMPVEQQIDKANQSIFDTDKLKSRLARLNKQNLDAQSLGNAIHQQIQDSYDNLVLGRPSIGKSNIGKMMIFGTAGEHKDLDLFENLFYNSQNIKPIVQYANVGVREVCNNSFFPSTYNVGIDDGYVDRRMDSYGMQLAQYKNPMLPKDCFVRSLEGIPSKNEKLLLVL